MMRDWITDLGLTAGPIASLGLFLLLFAGMLIWVFRPGSHARYEQQAWLPIDGSDGSAGGDATQGTEPPFADSASNAAPGSGSGQARNARPHTSMEKQHG